MADYKTKHMGVTFLSLGSVSYYHPFYIIRMVLLIGGKVIVVFLVVAVSLTYGHQVLDPYEELGLDKSASRQEVKKTFKELSLQYHPDRSAVSEASLERYQRIIQAYELIKQEWT